MDQAGQDHHLCWVSSKPLSSPWAMSQTPFLQSSSAIMGGELGRQLGHDGQFERHERSQLKQCDQYPEYRELYHQLCVFPFLLQNL